MQFIRALANRFGMDSVRVKRLLNLVRSYSMVDDLRLTALLHLTQEICRNNVFGDVVECGVCNGGSAAVFAKVIASCPDRTIWLYDTFAGIPPPSGYDDPLANQHTGQFKGDVQKVKEVLGKVGFPLNRVVFREGLFDETFEQPRPKEVAILHIDADWYFSVLNSLRAFYPLVSKGGVIILDDFGHWEGTRKAFYAFCREFDIQPLLERTGYTQAYWFKEREHN